MKRVLALVLVLLLSALAAAEVHEHEETAGQESAPDGLTYTGFSVTYREDLLDGFGTVAYPDAAGLLFSAYSDDTEITVSVDDAGEAGDAADFLKKHVSNVSRYGRVTVSSGPFQWENAWNEDGASMRYSYMHIKGADTDDEYHTSIYAAPFSEGAYLVICLNAWGEDAAGQVLRFETEFVPSLKIESMRVSAPYLAYLRSACTAQDGRMHLTLDFCSIEFDASIFTIYTRNGDPTLYDYAVKENALLYLPDTNDRIYAVHRVAPDVETLQSIVEAYRVKNGTDAIYQVLFDENNEIAWMLHYNAY